MANAAITLKDNFDVVVAFRGVGDLNAAGRHPIMATYINIVHAAHLTILDPILMAP